MSREPPARHSPRSADTSEFDLIQRFFNRPIRHTVLGVGDDGALINPTPGRQLVVSSDLLVEGTHFFADAEPQALGWKTLAVNLSDMAAMGAQPRWALLAMSLPEAGLDWLEAFAQGFFACAEKFDVDLVGGDTTRGPPATRTFCVTILGEVSPGQALRRSGAQPGDAIWVSGAPGRAALGLAHLKGRSQLVGDVLAECLNALHRPQPRVELGLALQGLATSAIDVSDGLLADLGHILGQSGGAARLQIPKLPPAGLERDCFLSGGDDYELIFTAPPVRGGEILELGRRLELPLRCIGEIASGAPGTLVLCDDKGSPITPAYGGYDHFKRNG